MKRITTLLLAAAMLLGLTACGVPTVSTTGATTPPTTSESPATPSEEGQTSVDESASAPAESSADDLPSSDLPAYTGEAAELRFTWWGGDARAERTNKVIELFEEAYPDIKIKAEPRPGDSYWDNLNTQIGGGNAPDIMQFGGNYPDFVNRDVLLALDEYNGTLLQIDTAEKFDQAVLKTGTMNDKLYVVSLGTNVLVLVYNQTILETAGLDLPPSSMTWDEMMEYGRSIKDKLPEGVFPFVDNSANQANYVSYFMTQRGEPIWTYEEESHVTEEGIRAWIDIWEDMREEGLIPDIDTTAGYGETSVDNSILVPGKAVMGLIWSNQIGTYQDAMTDTLGLVPLPVGKEDALTIQVSQYLAINAKTPHPDAAALFINFFVNQPEAGIVLGNDRGVSSSPNVREAIAAQAGPQDRQIYDYYDLVIPKSIPQGPNLPNDQEFIDNFKTISQSVAFGRTTREDGAKEIYDLIKRLMVK